MWTSVACTTRAITRRKVSSSLRKLSTKEDYTFPEMSRQLEPYSKNLTLIGGAAVVLGGAVSYVSGLKREIDVNKVEAEKQIVETEKQIDVMKENTAKQIAIAEKQTMENFLKFGYAEEFARYQKVAGVYKPEGSDKE